MKKFNPLRGRILHGLVNNYLFILKIIFEEGLSKEEAASLASKKFGVSESNIWKRGGF